MVKHKHLEKKIGYFCLLTTYRLSLDYVYTVVISQSFAYEGYIFSPSLEKIIESYIYMYILFFITDCEIKNIKTYFINIQLLIFILPMLTYYALANQSREFILLICGFHILQVVLLKKIKIESKIKITKISNVFIMFLYIIVIFTLIGSVLLNGIPTLAAFNLQNIYDIRDEVVMGFPLVYLVPWCAKVILPFLIVYNLNKKKKIKTILFTVSQILLFMIYAHKSFLFSLIELLIIYFLVNRKVLKKMFYPILTIAIAIPTLIFQSFHLFSDYLSFGVRRFLFVPALNKFVYFDFFSLHEKVHFATGFTGSIVGLFGIQNPYEPYIISTVIATYKAGHFSTGTNTGYMAEAYANGGVWGMLLIAVLMVLFILILDNVSSNLDLGVVLGTATTLLIALNDAAFFTSLITGGGVVLIVLFYFYDSDEYVNNKKAPVLKRDSSA